MFNNKDDKRKREILFRGQTRRQGEKVYISGKPVPSNWVEGYGVCLGKGDFSIIYSGESVEKFVVYTDTVCEYAGLTDCNGVKIFEGDILQLSFTNGSKYCSPVIFEDGSFCLDDDLLNDAFQVRYSGLLEFVVVGNIYDNLDCSK